jgi:hypothetical protein
VQSVACKITVFVHISLFVVPIGTGRASSPAIIPLDLLNQNIIYANTRTERVVIAATLWILIHGVLDSKVL